MNDMFYQPNGNAFSNMQPMKRVTSNEFLNSVEDLYRYKGDDAFGTFYPVRILPSAFIDADSEWPIVMPAGLIVSAKAIKDANAYTADDAETGINQSGEVYVSMGVDDVALAQPINNVYPKYVQGLLVPCNGGLQTNLSYSDDDGTYGILDPSGEIVTSSTTAYVNTANKPLGIVNHMVWADLRNRYLNYDRTHGVAVQRGGVLEIPCVLVYGAGTRSTVTTAIRAAVNSKHQYMMVSEANEDTAEGIVLQGTYLASDAYGRFQKWTAASDDSQKFGEVISRMSRVPYALDEIVDSFPGSGMKGTDTGGLEARLYDFITKIMARAEIKPAGWTASKENKKKLMYEGLTTNVANVSIKFCTVVVAFGTAVK